MNIIKYLQGVRGEMKHINWLTRDEVIAYTALVIAVSIFVAVYIGALDISFQKGLNYLIK